MRLKLATVAVGAFVACLAVAPYILLCALVYPFALLVDRDPRAIGAVGGIVLACAALWAVG